MSVFRVGASVLTLAVCLLATGAHAQDRVADNELGGRHKSFESPQHFAAEVRFSPFTPNIDSDPALQGQTPYRDVFGTAPRLFVSAELDWQVYRIPHLGTIGPGFGVGYTTMSDPAHFTQVHNGTTVSGEQTSLDIWPFYLVAVLRVDAPWREARIPLVPYVKAGLGYALWRASNDLGTSSYLGVSGTGHSIGAQLAVGLGLNLNVFDPYAAKNFDDAMGVNNSYLFAELTSAELNGLGLQRDPLRVGGTSWTFGLAFEF